MEIKFKVEPKTEAELEEWYFVNVVIPKLAGCGFEKRFHRKQSLISEQQTIYTRMEEKLVNVGAIVALVGERGLGKTTLAAALAQKRAADESLCPSGQTVLYRKMTGLIEKYKALYADFGSIDAEDARISRDAICRNPGLLVIDELHEGDDQKMKSRVLVDIVDRRYAALKDTILISNQLPDDFMATTSDSILSRLNEHGEILECVWPSFRE